jgi:hypothetical protein
MMKNNLIFKGLAVLLLLGAFQASVLAAPACKGQSKNDPGCNQEVAAAAVVVDSVTVDWLNEKLVVRGSGLAGATTFVLGNSVSLAVPIMTDTELDNAPVKQTGPWNQQSSGESLQRIASRSKGHS